MQESGDACDGDSYIFFYLIQLNAESQGMLVNAVNCVADCG